MNNINRKTEASLKAGREVGLEVNAESPSMWLCLATKEQDDTRIYRLLVKNVETW
jgi:hypothetical protein